VELGEDQADSLLDALIGIDLDPVVLAPAETRRQGEAEFAPASLGIAGGQTPCRKRLSSYSDIVPFNPSSSRSFIRRGIRRGS